MENGQSTQAAPAIPINQVLAAAKDVELKKLLRARATAEARITRAIQQATKAQAAIEEYVARRYPNDSSVTL